MQCLDCSPSLKDKKEPDYSKAYAKGAESSCKYYSDNIRGNKNLSAEENNFMDKEVFTCSEGPRASELASGRKWDMLSYSSGGKFGSLVDLKIQCYVNPYPDENGAHQTVNLTCCNLNKSDSEYKRMQSSLKEYYQDHKITQGDFKKLDLGKYRGPSNGANKSIESLNDDLQKGNLNTFCNYVKAGYKFDSGVEKQQSEVKLCKDYTGEFIYKTENKNLFDSKMKAYNNASDPSKDAIVIEN
jgi:hypothetical protein